MFSTKSVPYNHKNFDRSEIGSNFATRNETKDYRLQQYRQFLFQQYNSRQVDKYINYDNNVYPTMTTMYINNIDNKLQQ